MQCTTNEHVLYCMYMYVHVCTMYMYIISYIVYTCAEFLSECSAREEGKFLISNLSSRQVKH